MAIRREMKETRTIVESGLALANIALEEGQAADAEQQAEAVAGSVESTTAPMRTAGKLIVSRARLVRGDAAGASRRSCCRAPAVERHRADCAPERDCDGGAEIAAAQGRDREARQALAELQRTFATSGMILEELERRLLLLRLDAAGGRPNVKAAARALEKDASVRGAGLITRRAQAL